MVETNLAPGRLLAMPRSADSSVSGAVVLLIQHTAQGWFGLVINRPSPVKASELLESLKMRWAGDDTAVVWSGGPVAPQSCWVLHEATQLAPSGDGTTAITSTISLSTTPARLQAIASAPPDRIRVVLGNVAWAPRQIAKLSRGVISTAATTELVFDTYPNHLWDRVRSTGVASPASAGIIGRLRRLFGPRR